MVSTFINFFFYFCVSFLNRFGILLSQKKIKIILSPYPVLLTHRTTLPLHVNWFIAAGAGTVDASTHRFIHPLRTATERAGVDKFCLPSFNFGTIGCNTALIRLLLRKNGAGDKPNEKNGEYRCFLHYLQKKISAILSWI